MGFLCYLRAVVIVSCVRGQTVICNGDCQCSPFSEEETSCVMDCSAEDSCKGSTTTCRTGDSCEIICDAKASCSSGAVLDGSSATDVTILCGAEDACKSGTTILCGIANCLLYCIRSTSCQDISEVNVDHAKSFRCVGECPSRVPAPFTAQPTVQPTTHEPSTSKPTTDAPITNNPVPSPSSKSSSSSGTQSTQVITNLGKLTANPTTLTLQPTSSLAMNAISHPPTRNGNLYVEMEAQQEPNVVTTTAIISSTEDVTPRYIVIHSSFDASETVMILTLSIGLCCASMLSLWWIQELYKRKASGSPKPKKQNFSVSNQTEMVPQMELQLCNTLPDSIATRITVYGNCDDSPCAGEHTETLSSDDDIYDPCTVSPEVDALSVPQQRCTQGGPGSVRSEPIFIPVCGKSLIWNESCYDEGESDPYASVSIEENINTHTLGSITDFRQQQLEDATNFSRATV